MNLHDALAMQTKIHQRKIALRARKGHDYAKTRDVHSNFKVLAALQAALTRYGYEVRVDTPEGVALWHMLHKFVRILNLLNDEKNPKNESIDDSFDDLEIYSQIAREIWSEGRKP